MGDLNVQRRRSCRAKNRTVPTRYNHGPSKSDRTALELANELNSPLEGAELPSIQDICDRFDKGTRSVYSLYRQLTDSVHVSLATVLAYMKIGDGGVEGLLSHPATKQDRDLFLATGWSAVLAMDAIESLRKGRPFRSVIRKLAQSHTLTSDLASADSKPHLQRRPQE